MLEVVAALFRREERFMICQRPPHKARALLWEFPGGKIEPGETPEAALARECREELGADVTVGKPYCSVVYEYPDITVRLTVFDASFRPGSGPQRLEHADIRWITPAEIPEYVFCPADGAVLDRLRAETGLPPVTK